MLDLKQLEFQYITNQAGEKTSVILPMEQLKELIEDIEDLVAVAEQCEEPTISPQEPLTGFERVLIALSTKF